MLLYKPDKRTDSTCLHTDRRRRIIMNRNNNIVLESDSPTRLGDASRRVYVIRMNTVSSRTLRYDRLNNTILNHYRSILLLLLLL